MGRKDAESILPRQDIRGNKAFRCPKPIGSLEDVERRVYDREPGKDDHPRGIQTRMGIVAGKIIVRIMQLRLDVGDIGFEAVTGQWLVKFLETEDISLLTADEFEHLHPRSDRWPLSCNKVV